ncbi:MAG: GIY-YIG nuclease family protein, partial [Campylobacterota bacterium]|nr:GIY-YIG nuclease family protein [Campylobacterota bacterium]
GVPTEFVLEYKIHVPDCDIAEKKVHKSLCTFRVSNNREFFKISVNEAKNMIRKNIVGFIGDELFKYYDNELIAEVIDYIFLKNKTIKDYSFPLTHIKIYTK